MGAILNTACLNAALKACNIDFNNNGVALQALPASLQALSASFTRNSVKNVVQNGALVQLSANQFGTSYDAVTGLYGYVPEPAATNLLTYSKDFSNAAWTKTNVTVSADSAVAPDGTTTSDLLTRGSTAAANSQSVVVSKAASAIAYTASYFVKKSVGDYVALRIMGLTSANCADVIFNINTGAIATAASVTGAFTAAAASIVSIGSYYRVSLTATSDTATSISSLVSFNSNNSKVDAVDSAANSAGYAWGAQLETSPRATSYIATGAATATRAASVLSVPLANIPGFTAAQYTLFADFRAIVSMTSPTFLLSVTSDGNNYSSINTYSNSLNNVVLTGGVVQYSGGSSPTVTNRTKGALSAMTNKALHACNGSSGTPDVTVTMPAINTLYLGILGGSGGTQFNGFLFRAGLVPVALTQAQINGLTL